MAGLLSDIVAPLSAVLGLMFFASDDDFFVLHCTWRYSMKAT